VAALAQNGNGEPREVDRALLEVAVLDRDRKQPRKFRRLLGSQLAALFEDQPGADEAVLEENGEAEAAQSDEELDTNSLIDEALEGGAEHTDSEDEPTGDDN
jgi:proteasome alpha subunit